MGSINPSLPPGVNPNPPLVGDETRRIRNKNESGGQPQGFSLSQGQDRENKLDKSKDSVGAKGLDETPKTPEQIQDEAHREMIEKQREALEKQLNDAKKRIEDNISKKIER